MRITQTSTRVAGALALSSAMLLSVVAVNAQKTAPAGKAGGTATGKALVAKNRCITCHGANLKGSPGGAPDITGGGREMRHYTAPLFQRLLNKGLDEEGKPVRPAMPKFPTITKQQSDAIYAYLKSLK